MYCSMRKLQYIEKTVHMWNEGRVLEGDGSIVGVVRCDDAGGLGHLVTGNVQLTHLSEAFHLEKGEVSYSSSSPQENSSQVSLHNHHRSFGGFSFSFNFSTD